MKQILYNPVYESLLAADRRLGSGTEKVKYFDAEVSPFASFEDGYDKGFEELHQLLPEGRVILYAIPTTIKEPDGWQMLHEIQGLQMVFEPGSISRTGDEDPVALQLEHVPEMTDLATLTRPGPFGPRTIEFGHYFGIFENGKLAAMTGQRLHVQEYTEISAVCTHPTQLGKGYASTLMRHQIELILNQGQKPFLHVREDNTRAINIYLRLGFKINGPMNFYVLKNKAV